MTAQYEWKNLSASIAVGQSAFPKSYGLVRRNGKMFYRNYKRPLKNGGLSFLDIFEKKRSDYLRNLAAYLDKPLFTV